jgi:lysophospholipase L1-like esterase
MYRLTSLLGLTAACVLLGQPAKEGDRAARWEKEVSALEKRQRESPPAKGGIVFAGSSTIRLWDLNESFPDWQATNSGFGGSEIRDVTRFAEQLILKHEPRAIVFYAGDNDVKSGRTPDQVLTDFRAFVAATHKTLPRARVYFIAIKPSLARWELFDVQADANARVKSACATDDRLAFIDIVAPMLGRDGMPRPDLFVGDMLHLSPKGYEVLTTAVKQAVK